MDDPKDYKARLRERLSVHIAYLEEIAESSKSDIARITAIEKLLKLTDVAGMEPPKLTPIEIVKADPSKRKILSMNEAV